MSEERRTTEVSITEKSQVRLPLGTAISVTGALIAMAVSGALAWQSLKDRQERHENNVNVHLDPGFVREHGLPVGKWDVAAHDEQTARALEAFQRQVDYAVKKADALEAEANNRKPRWRP